MRFIVHITSTQISQNSKYSELNVNQYCVGSPCFDSNLIHYKATTKPHENAVGLKAIELKNSRPPQMQFDSNQTIRHITLF
jgi:hypothetical protein